MSHDIIKSHKSLMKFNNEKLQFCLTGWILVGGNLNFDAVQSNESHRTKHLKKIES